MTPELYLPAAVILTALAVAWLVYGVLMPGEPDEDVSPWHEDWRCPNGWPLRLCRFGAHGTYTGNLIIPDRIVPWSPSGQGGL